MTQPDTKNTPAKTGRAGGELTPLLRQFQQIKTEHPDHVLFFRCGDFYEMFFDDARVCAEALGITLTSRGTDTEGNPVPMAGVPFHSVEGYLARMIRSGYRVAMCEQMENPKTAKGIVRREVTRIVTPGTVLEESLLSDKANNYLVALVGGGSISEEDDLATGARVGQFASLGLAALDFSTGEFLACEFHRATAAADCLTELIRLAPSEIIVPEDQRQCFEASDMLEAFGLEASAGSGNEARQQMVPLATADPAAITANAARAALLQQFGVRDLHGFGLEDHPLAIQAAGAVLQYLKETQRSTLHHVRELHLHTPENYMVLDATTQRSLELVTNLTDASRRHTLFEVLDRTATAMGGRMLRSWILQPLRDPAAITARLDAVEALTTNYDARQQLSELLKGIADMERITSRCACGSANGRDLLSLKASLQRITPLRELLSRLGSIAPVVPGVIPVPAGTAHGQPAEHTHHQNGTNNFPDAHGDPILSHGNKLADVSTSAEKNQGETRRNLLHKLIESLNPLDALTARLEAALVDQPPLSIRDGGILKDGYNAELDELRSLTGDSKSWIAALRQREAERTGISNLKVGFNRVFGYYLEVSHGNASKVPPEWIRKQTLTGGERYVTPELKEKEEVILNADERANELEFTLFEELRAGVCAETAAIQTTAHAIARLDALYALATVACFRNYVRPQIAPEDGTREITIRDGRHPVLESLRGDTPFVPNDTRINNSDEQILIITGPNMAGKSTYIRQVALITLMAHLGSFVPASEATIAPVDRIFTRVGAMDQIAKGQSTFLVEMSETANILNNATDNSLVILDEIGRGTSTYDGLSIAWSVVEYLHNTPGRRPKALFATHYHELAGLEGPLERVRNYNVAVHEEEERVAFLYRILRGHTDHSYGIYAAQVAGLPREAVSRARRILADLEKGNVIHVQTSQHDASDAATAKPSRRDSSVRVEERTVQLTFFDLADHPVLEKLRNVEINTLTPLQALSLLADLKQDAKN